jgi:hypothetical protein
MYQLFLRAINPQAQNRYAVEIVKSLFPHSTAHLSTTKDTVLHELTSTSSSSPMNSHQTSCNDPSHSGELSQQQIEEYYLQFTAHYLHISVPLSIFTTTTAITPTANSAHPSTK